MNKFKMKFISLFGFIISNFIIIAVVDCIIYYVKAQLPGDVLTVNPPNCGERPITSNKDPLKIVGGVQSIPGDWGWQVALNFNGRFICGGALINSQWLATAAHCLYGRQTTPGLYTIDIGIHDRTVPETWSVTKKGRLIVMHGSFSPIDFRNDIALIKLDTPVTYSDYIVPACIPSNSSSYPGLTSIATGWGTTQSGGSVTRYLMQVAMPWLTDSRCKEKYPTIADIANSVCAGETGDNTDTCQGDSGGPLNVKIGSKWMLGGLTSWGYGCGDGGVYTRVSLFLPWIQFVVKNYIQ